MFRIDTPNKAVDLFGAGKHGFRDGDQALGVAPTELSAAQQNALQEELAGVCEAAGIVLNKANNTQLLEAIQRLIDAQSGNYALDTGAANAYVVALSPAITAYADGMTVRVKAVNPNAGASTLNAGGGVVALVNDAGGALEEGDIPAGGIFTATYVASAEKFYITSMVKSQGIVPVSAVVYLPGSVLPSGYLKANGAAISRTAYAALYAAIGTVFGVGDGATTFNLPDLRGEFIRSAADGRAVDTGRVIGSYQSDALQDHTHTANALYLGTQPGGGGDSSGGTALFTTPSTGGALGATVAAETRPRNIALLAIIKY